MSRKTSHVVEIVILSLAALAVAVVASWVILGAPGCAVEQRLGKIETALAHIESTVSTQAGRDIGVTGAQIVKITAWGGITYIMSKYVWIAGAWLKGHAMRIASHRRLKK
jgi:hypothetical protein